MYKLGPRSQTRLKGVHPDLVKVVERAILSPGEYALKAGDALVSLQDDPVKVLGVESDGTYVLDRAYLHASLG